MIRSLAAYLLLGMLSTVALVHAHAQEVVPASPAGGAEPAQVFPTTPLEAVGKMFNDVLRGKLPRGNSASRVNHELSKPVSAEVLAEIEKCIAQLASGMFPQREAAAARLIEIGAPAAAALAESVKSDDAELRFRAEELLKIVQSHEFRESQLLTDHDDVVCSVSFSHGGDRLASGGGGKHQNGTWLAGSDFTIRMWDIGRGSVVRRIEGHTALVSRVAWSQSNRYLLSASGDGTARIWNVDDRSEVRNFRGHEGPVTQALFLPGEEHVVTAGWDKTVRVWSVETGKEVRTIDWPHGRVWGLDVSPDGGMLAICGDNPIVRLHRVSDGELVRELNGHSNNAVAVAFSPNGDQLASCGWDNTVQVWNVHEKKPSLSFASQPGRLESVAWSPDGKLLAAGCLDNSVRMFDAAEGRLLRVYQGHTQSVSKIAFAPDGQSLASGSWDSTIRIWPVIDGKNREESESR